ncbi:MAG: efflux RND transporter permease subunit [bacterium]|nr:efflux RND transporter permease subunit [bacterium]MCP5067622.1 efflux RND transporter permease subunit [bacterium]
MKVLDRFIDRPLPVFLVAVVLVLAGIFCLSILPVKRSPNIVIPFALVAAPYVGAAPEDVETELTLELEEQLNTLDELRHMTTVSAEGYSTAILEFEDRADMTESLRDVRDKVDLAEVEFPDDADPAVVRELSLDDVPIIFFTLRGSDLYHLRDLAEDLKPHLESVPGVSQVDVFGGYEREVQILADPIVLAEFDVTQADLAQAIARQSRSLPAGELRSKGAQRLLRSTGEFRSLEEIRNIAISSEPLGVVTLRDVAEVRLTHVRLASSAWIDGEPSVTLRVRRRPHVNTLDTVARLLAEVERQRVKLPTGVLIETTSDTSDEIRRMIRQLGTSAVVGLVLVVGVLLWMFDLRQALLIGSVLPFALLSTFIGLYVFDMAISNIALFGLILVLGLVVDGAIIVGEAIQSEREAGLRPDQAAKAALDRVATPVIAADLTTIAAFVPMLLMVGVMGQFMSVLPKVVVFALLGSVFVDHLLIPAAAARIPRRPPPERKRGGWLAPDLGRMRALYTRALGKVLAHPAPVVAAALLALAGAGLLFTSGAIESIFLPRADRSRFTVNYALPLGTPLAETNRVGELLSQTVAQLPEVASYVLTTGDTGALSTDTRESGRYGPEYGRINVELVPSAERRRNQTEIVRDLRTDLAPFAGVEIDVHEPSEGPGVGAALAIRVKGESLSTIAVAARSVEAELASLAMAEDVRVDYDDTKPEIHIDVDRPRAAALFGIAPDQVSRALLTAFHGIEIGRMWIGGERVDLRLQAPESYGQTLERVRELPLRGASGAIVPLGEVATVDLRFTHDAIFRHDTRRTVTVRANVSGGASSVVLEASARQALAALPLPHDIDLEFGGETEERDRSYASLWDALKWAAVLIYAIVAVQFNSLRQPFIVLIAVPLSIIGVTLGLLVTGTPFSFMVFIGIVSLTGIVVNDGIVLIDAINRLRRAGLPLTDAVAQAAQTRFRPVLLTTITTIAGLLPLTLGIAEGGEFWAPLGIAVISGLLVASMMTLFLVPVIYLLIERPRRSFRR